MSGPTDLPRPPDPLDPPDVPDVPDPPDPPDVPDSPEQSSASGPEPLANPLNRSRSVPAAWWWAMAVLAVVALVAVGVAAIGRGPGGGDSLATSRSGAAGSTRDIPRSGSSETSPRAGDDADDSSTTADSSGTGSGRDRDGRDGHGEGDREGDRDGDGEGGRLHTAACAGDLVVESVSAPIADPGLVEVSGVAIDSAGVAWVINDSGDSARMFGLSPQAPSSGSTSYGSSSSGSASSGSASSSGEALERPAMEVRTVTVEGAENVDWEDVAVAAPDRSALWLADTGGNISPRSEVVLYRVPVPPAGATSVSAAAVGVVYPDGPHDTEAVVGTPDGSVLLFTKEPGRSRIYRVAVPAGLAGSTGGTDRTAVGASVTAEPLGEFAVGDGVTSLLTGADLSTDGSTVVLRTYGSVFVVAVPTGQSVAEALTDKSLRCRAIAPVEFQGESVALTPDGLGYVTVGEGTNPKLTTVRVRPAARPPE